MSIVVVIGAWLTCVLGGFLIGRSPVPANQHHSSALLLAGLCLCLHIAVGVHPAIPGFDDPQRLVAAVVGYGAAGAALAYVASRACMLVGTRLKTAP